MKVKFLKSPTGVFKLAYHVGEVAEIKDQKQAKELIESGYAEEIKGEKKAPEKASPKKKAPAKKK